MCICCLRISHETRKRGLPAPRPPRIIIAIVGMLVGLIIPVIGIQVYLHP